MPFFAPVFIALVLFITPFSFLHAQNETRGTAELGFAFGPLLPARNGLMELVPGWAVRGGLPSSLGFFEGEFYNGIGNGIVYRSAVVDYRLDLAVEPLLVHFLIGFHLDQYEQSTPEIPRRFAGGWHYGGGLTQWIAGPLDARFDFRHRFGPGQVVEVLVGLTYRLSGGQN